MMHITKANIENEITKMLEYSPMTCDNLERYVLLCKAIALHRRTYRSRLSQVMGEYSSIFVISFSMFAFVICIIAYASFMY